MLNSYIQPYSRCSIPSAVEPALSSSQPAAATRHQTAGREPLGGDTGTARQGADSDASDLSPNNPAPTPPPCLKQIW